jgi:hypothetical protein
LRAALGDDRRAPAAPRASSAVGSDVLMGH